jgi:predicted glycosyltransferase
VIRKLNRYFDALLIHADPGLVKLDETFGRMNEIQVPVVYTGYVATEPSPDARARIRKNLGIKDEDNLIVASAGGGKAGAPLMDAVIRAYPHLHPQSDCHLYLFAGPYMTESDYDRLNRYSGDRIKVARFVTDFLSYLAAADLSVSMGGYNTCMNLLSTGVRALVWPFSYDREQGIRVRRLARRGILRVLDDADLNPARLASLMEETLLEKTAPASGIDLNGASRTADWLIKQVNVS